MQMQNIIMTPTHTEIPLRRSEVRILQTPNQQAPVLNDDEEERRQRRITAYEESTTSDTIEDNETLKNCIKICNENKLSKENAWTVSVIDALAKLLDKHNKSFTNFKVAGSSLEASTKVYGLRVDSIHTDVLRLSSGLNNKKISERNNEENFDSQNDNNDNSKTNENPDGQNDKEQQQQQKSKSKRRKRNLISTITKNIETINSKLDTNPFIDPIFAKLNSIGGSINSSGRLLQNILPSIDSEIMLRMDYDFWDITEPQISSLLDNDKILLDDQNINDEEQINLLLKEYENINELIDFDVMDTIILDNLQLRNLHSGYIICDTPTENYDDNNGENHKIPETFLNNDQHQDNNESQLQMAFDINADIEPADADGPNFMDVDMDELHELSMEEQVAITNCRQLRRKPVIVEDMRPIDSTSSKLEYSYRPLNKISQFWAGPSHWKFKRSTRNSHLIMMRSQMYGSSRSGCGGGGGGVDNGGVTKIQNCKNANDRARLKRALALEKEIDVGIVNEKLFLHINTEISRKLRKVNIQKKWDAKRLKLPTDLRYNSDIFDKFYFAPGYQFIRNLNHRFVVDDDDDDDDNDNDSMMLQEDVPTTSDYDNYNDPINNQNIPNNDNAMDNSINVPMTQQNEILPSQAIVEIPTDFLGAPDKVTRIIVPFAKRAKVIDMKQLKKCCLHLIKHQIIKTNNKENLPDDIIDDNTNNNISNSNNNINNSINNIIKNQYNNEKYKKGYTTFKQIYTDLPNILSTNMKDALSPSIAIYSILHLANETSLRLIPTLDNSSNFKILQLENSN